MALKADEAVVILDQIFFILEKCVDAVAKKWFPEVDRSGLEPPTFIPIATAIRLWGLPTVDEGSPSDIIFTVEICKGKSIEEHPYSKLFFLKLFFFDNLSGFWRFLG